MSSRWPQAQQDQRSPYATYDEAWPQESGAEQPWQDDGWQAPDQYDSGQWAQRSGWQSQPGRAAVAQAVAPPQSRAGGRSRSEAADPFQGDWDQSGGGAGDDADYAWFEYLSGGRSAEPRPDGPDEGRPGRDSARRGGGRQERSRSRRGKAREPEADTGPAGPAATDPRYARDAIPSQNVTTDPGRHHATTGSGAAEDPGYGRAGRRSRHGRPEPAEPGYGQASAAGWPATAEWTAADQGPLPGWPAPDSGYGGNDVAIWPGAGDPGQDHAPVAGWPTAEDPGQHQGHLAGWPAAGDSAPGAAHLAGWPAAGDARQDQAPASQWAEADWRQEEAPATGWSAVADARLDQRPVAGWPAVEPALDQPQAGWAAAEDLAPDQGHAAGWPAAEDPVPDQGRVAGWPAAGDSRSDRGGVPGWPAAGDPRQDQAPVPGWPVAAEQGYGQAGTAAWPEADQSPVPGWPAADGGYQQADTGYRQASASIAETGYGWSAAPDPQHDQAPVPGWPSVGPDYGWPADDDSGRLQPARNGWPDTADAAEAAWAADTGPAARAATIVKTREQAPGATRAPARDDDDLDTELAAPDATATRSTRTQRTARRPTERPGKPAKRPGRQTAVKQQPRGRAAKKAAVQDGPRLLSPAAPSQDRSSPAIPAEDGSRLLSPAAPEAKPSRQKSRPRSGRKARGRLTTRVIALTGASAAVAGAAAFVVLTRPGGGVPHVITVPATLGAYSEQPQLAKQMHAAALRQQIIDQSAGEVHNVVYAVYEDSTGPAASSGPQIILFIGGNLSGTSAGSFISAFTGKLPDAATTSAGTLGGAAACVPSVDGRVAECVWADNDTFGVVASQTLSPVALAAEMRQMRPVVEHPASTRH